MARTTSIRKRLLLAFVVVVLINFVAQIVIYRQNEEIFEVANETEDDIEVQLRIDASISELRAVSSGIFLIAAGRAGMGQSAVLEAELSLREIEADLADVDWDHFGVDSEDIARIVALKNSLLEQAETVLALSTRIAGEDGEPTPEQLTRARGQLAVALSRTAMLTEHANLYVTRIMDMIREHAHSRGQRGRSLIGTVRVATIVTVAAVTAVALIVSLAFAGSLSRRIAALERITTAFGGGDLSARAEISGSDEITVLAGSFNQMADELQTNIDLRLSVEYVENILDTMTNGLLVIDADGRIERTNRAVCELSGYPADELRDVDVGLLLPGRSSGSDGPRALVAARRSVSDIEFDLPTASGGAVPVSFSSAVMTRGESHDGTKTVCVIDDVTERRRLIDELVTARRRAEDAARAKTVFLTTMSHELRTPLNGILGYVQILQADKSLSDKQQQAIDIMRRSGQHLLTLLDDILDLSRIEADRMEFHLSAFQLPNFVRDIAEVFRIQAQNKGLQFYLELLGSVPTAVRGDSKRIRQVLINLLGNAVKFTERGGVLFKVGLHEGRLRFQIEDTGPGIAPDQIERVFQPFAQARTTAARSTGTGLGLAISRRLAEMMGGRLEVDSTVGEGSVFRLELDLPVVDGWVSTEPAPPRPILGYQGRRRTVLIVDDKPENRGVLVGMLSPLDFRLVEASDGRDAIARAEAVRPDAILMDIRMPVMDGLDAARAIRALPALSETVIIAVSASAFGQNREQSLAAGCDDFITKPIQLDDVLDRLESLLELSWIRADEAAPPVEVEVPPPDQLTVLVESARRGDVKQIRAELDRIATIDPRFGPFVAELRQLAKLYRIKQIRELLRATVDSA